MDLEHWRSGLGTMPKTNQPSYTVLVHQVVQAAPEPLPFAEIMQRVQRLRPIDTKNPTGTIRGAIGQSRLIVNTGDGRYGWLPRLINGSLMRLTLAPADLDGKTIGLGEDTRALLWPAFFEIQSRRDINPIALQLPNRTTTAMELVHLQLSQWGMAGPAEFWQWFAALHAAPGDHLLLSAVDGEHKLYAVEFQPRAARDEAAITARNQAVVQAAVERLQRSTYGVADWDLDAIIPILRQYHPTVGFSIHEACLASRVTILGDHYQLSQETLKLLHDADCIVERLDKNGIFLAI